MITLFKSDKKYSLCEIKPALSKIVAKLINSIEPIGTHLKIIRYEFPCEACDISSWMQNQTLSHKFYFSSRDRSFEIAALGQAQSIKSDKPADLKELFEYCEDHLSDDNHHLRFYGGISFSPEPSGEEWKAFGQYHFFVPRFELLKNNNEYFFAFNINFNDIKKEIIEGILKDIEKIQFEITPKAFSIPKLTSSKNIPNKTEWDELFKKTLTAIETKAVEKIVLARKSEFVYDAAFDALGLLKKLKEKTPQCFHFYYEPIPNISFLGASPERLFRRGKGRLESEAIAGTTTRGKNPAEDEKLRQELLHSQKDNKEHAIVVESINTNLKPLCLQITVDSAAQILELSTGHHLLTQFNGTPRPTTENYHILQALHPTPAVAGKPTQEALKFITNNEPFSRGWYAGPIGYIGHDGSGFIVAIRCGLVEKNKLSLFAGAGIVKGSECDSEWGEIENKLSAFLQILNNGT